ncbi:MAG: hypothetical protein ACK4UJ_10575 [Leptonema sp. (in: bacteria)]
MDREDINPISIAKDEREIKELKEFKEGVIPFFEKVYENTKMLFSVLNSNILTNEEKKAISYEIKDIEFKINEIQNRNRTLILELTKDTITNEAQREYYTFFTDEINDLKLNFVLLVLHFIKIQDFYTTSMENLNFIKKVIIEKISPQSYFYQQFMEFQFRTLMLKFQKIDLFLRRLGIILSFKKPISKIQKVYDLVQFSPNIDYKYSLIFKENLKDYIESFFQTKKEITEHEKKIENQKKIVTTEIKEFNKTKNFIENNMLNTSGKYLWNSSLYYFLTYDPELLNKEELYFHNVFYIDTHLGATPELMKSQIVRSYMKGNLMQPEEAKEKYKNFLNSLFEMNKQILCFNFKIPNPMSFVFVYHLGPATFFSINKQYLQDLKTGYIHQIQTKNIIRKLIPFEFIKRYLFDWWIENIMNFVSEEDRNDYNKYSLLNRHIQKFIFNISREFKSQFPNEDVVWENPKFQEYLKKKIGIVNHLLVQRYRNLFKHFEIG